MTSLYSGLALGLLLAITAVGTAFWVEKRQLSGVQALAAVVVGMLGRMFVLGIWTAVGFAVLQHEPLQFVAGLGVPWLIGQAIEIALLLRARRPAPGGGETR